MYAPSTTAMATLAHQLRVHYRHAYIPPGISAYRLILRHISADSVHVRDDSFHLLFGVPIRTAGVLEGVLTVLDELLGSLSVRRQR